MQKTNRTITVPIIHSTDYWFKVVEFLQQNWAVIEPCSDGVIVYFFSDNSIIFDSMVFDNEQLARKGLLANGFERLEDAPDFLEAIGKPSGGFEWDIHSDGQIYSSGRFWI
jgi:hypothetical protein